MKLFDASSLLNLIVKGGGRVIDLLRDQYILDLTIYETYNGIWRLSVLRGRLSREEAGKLTTAVAMLAQRLKVLPVRGLDLQEVMDLAVEERVTFYDASYIHASRANGLTLVTDDLKLLEAASRHVETVKSSELSKVDA